MAWTHFVAKAGLNFTILPPQPPKFPGLGRDHHVHLYLYVSVFRSSLEASDMFVVRVSRLVQSLFSSLSVSISAFPSNRPERMLLIGDSHVDLCIHGLAVRVVSRVIIPCLIFWCLDHSLCGKFPLSEQLKSRGSTLPLMLSCGEFG